MLSNDDASTPPLYRRVTIIAGFILGACSSQHSPAPVSVLDSQPNASYAVVKNDKYEVKKGDTLYSIAWYSGNDYRDIAKWNNISPPYVIKIGQTLNIRRQSVNLSTPTRTGSQPPPTSPAKTPKPVERPKNSAYGRNKSVPQPNLAKRGIRQFPTTVEKWVWPVRGKVVETFKTSGAVNKGINIQAPLGAPVVAAADGKVVYTGNALRGYGNLVIVKHSETFLSAYAHNNKIMVSEQQWIRAGEQIATIGSSGTNVTQLHFEVRYKGKPLDPMRFLSTQ